MATSPNSITSPDDPQLDALCRELRLRADALDASGNWPAEQLRLVAEAGVLRWFVPREWGGNEWTDVDVLKAYLKLSAACLATTFVVTQPAGLCRRIAESDNEWLKSEWLPRLAAGEVFGSVGISQLTTSRRHLGKPVMAVEETTDAFVLEGLIPWVTGNTHADLVATGGTMADGRQVLLVLPTNLPGVSAGEPAPMIGLSSTHTGEIRCQKVHVGRQWLLAGPVENVMAQSRGGPGGLQTSALAIGVASAAIEYLEHESERRPELSAPTIGLRREQQMAEADLLSLAAGFAACSTEDLRFRANTIALRASQAALSAAKGTGYIVGHPAGRWCREALFFLVWSCPQPVMSATLCHLAGIE
jgi:alkylation response protein AidB-like acyl-CoA dehydrogenase